MSFLVLRESRLTEARLARALEQTPPGSVRGIHLAGNPDLGPGAAELLLASGHLRHLDMLDLSGVYLGDTATAQLLSSPDAAGLRTLLLGGMERQALGVPPAFDRRWAAMATCGVGDAALDAIAALPALERLDLRFAEASPDAWRRFATSAAPPRLTAFGAAMVDLPEDAACALVDRARQLVGLALACCKLGDAVIDALVQADPPALQRLILPLNRFSRAGVATLMAARLPSLAVLDLQGQALDAPTLDTLAARTGLAALRTLVLDDRTVIENGLEDVWYDQGAVVGSSPDVLRLYDVKKRWFAGSPVELRDWPSHWPGAWLP